MLANIEYWELSWLRLAMSSVIKAFLRRGLDEPKDVQTVIIDSHSLELYGDVLGELLDKSLVELVLLPKGLGFLFLILITIINLRIY